MRYTAIALDYDGTIAHDGIVPPHVLDGLRRLKKSGRKLLLFYDGSKLRMVGWKTPRGAYYVTNTIGRKISNTRLIAIATSLRRLNS